MAETVRLKELLRARLLTKCETVYYQRAKDTTGTKYIVFTLDDVTYDETAKLIDFDVHIVGKGTDPTEIENLTDEIWALFNHYYVCESDVGFVVYPSVRNTIAEEDKQIIHRRILFNLKLFNGGY